MGQARIQALSTRVQLISGPPGVPSTARVGGDDG